MPMFMPINNHTPRLTTSLCTLSSLSPLLNLHRRDLSRSTTSIAILSRTLDLTPTMPRTTQTLPRCLLCLTTSSRLHQTIATSAHMPSRLLNTFTTTLPWIGNRQPSALLPPQLPATRGLFDHSHFFLCFAYDHFDSGSDHHFTVQPFSFSPF